MVCWAWSFMSHYTCSIVIPGQEIIWTLLQAVSKTVLLIFTMHSVLVPQHQAFFNAHRLEQRPSSKLSFRVDTRSNLDLAKLTKLRTVSHFGPRKTRGSCSFRFCMANPAASCSIHSPDTVSLVSVDPQWQELVWRSTGVAVMATLIRSLLLIGTNQQALQGRAAPGRTFLFWAGPAPQHDPSIPIPGPGWCCCAALCQTAVSSCSKAPGEPWLRPVCLMQTCSQPATAMVLPGRAFNAISQTSEYEFGSPLPVVFFSHPKCPSSLSQSQGLSLLVVLAGQGVLELPNWVCTLAASWPCVGMKLVYPTSYNTHVSTRKNPSRHGKLIYKSKLQVCFLCRVSLP